MYNMKYTLTEEDNIVTIEIKNIDIYSVLNNSYKSWVDKNVVASNFDTFLFGTEQSKKELFSDFLSSIKNEARKSRANTEYEISLSVEIINRTPQINLTNSTLPSILGLSYEKESVLYETHSYANETSQSQIAEYLDSKTYLSEEQSTNYNLPFGFNINLGSGTDESIVSTRLSNSENEATTFKINTNPYNPAKLGEFIKINIFGISEDYNPLYIKLNKIYSGAAALEMVNTYSTFTNIEIDPLSLNEEYIVYDFTIDASEVELLSEGLRVLNFIDVNLETMGDYKQTSSTSAISSFSQYMTNFILYDGEENVVNHYYMFQKHLIDCTNPVIRVGEQYTESEEYIEFRNW